MCKNILTVRPLHRYRNRYNPLRLLIELAEPPVLSLQYFGQILLVVFPTQFFQHG